LYYICIYKGGVSASWTQQQRIELPKYKRYGTALSLYNKTLVNKIFLSKFKDDLYDYKKQALKKLNHNKKVYLVDLIGNMCRFESVYLINENFDHIYSIFLGS
jgi:hypothetical protein